MSITREQAMAVARETGWLSRQSPGFQQDLLSRTVLRHFGRNEVICSVGDPYAGVHVLVSGMLKVEMLAPVEDYRIVTVKQSVFWFGQGASMVRGPYLATTTATTPAATLFLPHAEFERLVEDAAWCRAFAAMSVEHFEEASQVIGQLLVSDVESKVAARLALLAERSGPKRPAAVAVSQADLAEMCGLSRPTVQQILAGLEARGLLRCGYRRIEIDNPEMLARGTQLAQVVSRSGEEGE
jgi:CRP-like cAMP-binding protein